MTSSWNIPKLCSSFVLWCVLLWLVLLYLCGQFNPFPSKLFHWHPGNQLLHHQQCEPEQNGYMNAYNKWYNYNKTKTRVPMSRDIFYSICCPAGVLKSALGSYSYAFYLTGVLQVIASISTCLTYGISKHRAQRRASMVSIGRAGLNNPNVLIWGHLDK